MKHRYISQRKAFAFIAEHHRHHKPPRGAIVCIAAEVEGMIVGVAVIGRPVARMLDDGMTAEITRLCTDGTANAPSFLLTKAKRVAQAIGFNRVLTYTLPEEGGASLRGAGWECEGEAGGGSWSRASRGRDDKHPTGTKLRWRAA